MGPEKNREFGPVFGNLGNYSGLEFFGPELELPRKALVPALFKEILPRFTLQVLTPETIFNGKGFPWLNFFYPGKGTGSHFSTSGVLTGAYLISFPAGETPLGRITWSKLFKTFFNSGVPDTFRTQLGLPLGRPRKRNWFRQNWPFFKPRLALAIYFPWFGLQPAKVFGSSLEPGSQMVRVSHAFPGDYCPGGV